MDKIYTRKDMEEYLRWTATFPTKFSVEDWEQSKIKNDVWTPKEKEVYFAIDSNLEVMELRNNNEHNQKMINSNNCFETKKKIEQIPIKLFMAIWRWKLSNDDVPYIEQMWYINLQIPLVCPCTTSNKKDINVFFSTQEKGLHCLKWLKKEGLI